MIKFGRSSRLRNGALHRHAAADLWADEDEMVVSYHWEGHEAEDRTLRWWCSCRSPCRYDLLSLVALCCVVLWCEEAGCSKGRSNAG